VIFYVYALTDGLASGDLADLVGIQGERCEAVEVAGLGVVGGWAAEIPNVSRETLAAQDAVVRALHDRAPALLPARFGTGAPTLATLADSLQPRADILKSQLALVRGCEQMTLRVLGTAVAVESTVERDSDEAGAGRRYLEARAARAAPPVIEPIASAVRTRVRATHVETGRHPGVVATVYHLIPRGDASDYRKAVESVAATLPTVTVRISGPAPAYAFGT
jgi:hypothetical protein